MHSSITNKYGKELREERIEWAAEVVYGCILRRSRPWYKNPVWHVWHWQFQVRPWQQLRRWLFERCCKCGKGYTWNYSPMGNWRGNKTWHHNCEQAASLTEQVPDRRI